MEDTHDRKALNLEKKLLTDSARHSEEEGERRRFVLQIIQPGLVGLMDGSVSTLAPVFAAAFATHNSWNAFLVGLAASVGAGGNGNETVAGAEFLLSMVEYHWTSGNGDGSKMESGLRAQHELQKIEKQIAHLEATAGQGAQQELHQLQERVHALRREIVAHLSAWEKTELARHPQRPYTLDYVERIFSDWSEIHGDRGFADDPAIVCGMARFHGDDVMVVGHQ